MLAGFTSTLRSSANEDFTLRKWRHGTDPSRQAETSGRPWFTVIFQSSGSLPELSGSVFNTIIANGLVRAWYMRKIAAQKSSSFFKEPRKNMAAGALRTVYLTSVTIRHDIRM